MFMRKTQNRSFLLLAVLCALCASCSGGDGGSRSSQASSEEITEGNEAVEESPVLAYVNGKPALVDLGSSSCVPCQMMEEELDRLDSATGDLLDVQIIDVNQDGQAANDFGVRVIPTQVFLSETGEELFRHEGYISFDDMMAKWIELGYSFE